MPLQIPTPISKLPPWSAIAIKAPRSQHNTPRLASFMARSTVLTSFPRKLQMQTLFFIVLIATTWLLPRHWLLALLAMGENLISSTPLAPAYLHLPILTKIPTALPEKRSMMIGTTSLKSPLSRIPLSIAMLTKLSWAPTRHRRATSSRPSFALPASMVLDADLITSAACKRTT